MNMSIRTVLSPLLIINYVFGLKIFQLPTNHVRSWLGLFYILLLWLIYCFLRVHHATTYPNFDVYFTFSNLSDFTMLLSIVFGMYHNKKSRNCLKKLATVDTTLEKLRITTNYQQLRKKIIWIVLGWFVIAILISNVQIIFLKQRFNCNALTAIYLSYLSNHSMHINLLGDLTMTSVIGYIGTKFNQINEHLKNMANNNKYGMTQAWNNTVLHTPQRQFAKTPSNKWMIWIIIQLHLELRKISRELDSIYGMEMTFKMGCYFIFMAAAFNEIFHVIFIPNYTNHTVFFAMTVTMWCCYFISKLLVINLVCEKVSNQANSTKTFLNKISHSMNDVETYENISQLLLHINQSPLRFWGIGLFQFGYKFIFGFVPSVGTVLVILIQAHIQSDNMIKYIQDAPRNCDHDSSDTSDNLTKNCFQ